MHAYIVTGGSQEKRNEKIQALVSRHSVSPHDVVTLSPDPNTIGVESVRAVLARIAISPIGGTRHMVVVMDAQTMTEEAQNAFLKTLEEPPGDAFIILETGTPDALLPTILSRSQLVTLRTDQSYSTQEILQCIDTLKYFNEAAAGETLKKIDDLFKTRDEALSFINMSITALQTELISSHQHATLLRALLAARIHILGNVNHKLALDAVFLAPVIARSPAVRAG